MKNKTGQYSRYVMVCLLFCLTINRSDASEQGYHVTIAGFGGSDVIAMNRLVKHVLAEDFARKGIAVSYFAVESDYPKYILNSLSSGNAPDAFYVDANAATPWIKTGKLLPLSEQLVSSRRNIHPVLMSVFNKNDRQYAIPKDVNALGLVFNRDIFDDANVPYPTNDDDWYSFKKKLRAVVERLQDEGVTGLCITEDFERFAPFLFSTGWKPYDQTYRTLLDGDFKRAFEFYVSLLKDGLAILPADIGQRWGGGCFATERAAVTIEGAWLAAFLNDRAPNLLYQTTYVPKDPATGKHGNILFTAGWAIQAGTQNQAAVEEVIRLLTSEKAQRAVLESGLALPSLTTMADEPYFDEGQPKNQLAKTIFEAALVDNVSVAAYGPYGNNWIEPIKIALASVLLGQQSVTDAISDAQRKYDLLHSKLNP